MALLLAVLIVSTGLVSCSVYSGYKKAIRLDENVNAAFAKVESKLQRRFDLVDNLVETVKGVAGHEKEVFTDIANARKAYFAADSTRGKVQASNMFESALSRLLVLRETYPELKANEAFMKLMDSLEGTENRISVERDRYAEAVRQLNTYVRAPWGGLCAGLAGVEPAEHFQAVEEAQTAPKVDFSDQRAPTPAPAGGSAPEPGAGSAADEDG